MTIYAANDRMAVTIPVEGFGGCGVLHSRPVANGAPLYPWELNCPPCENHLRSDPGWSVTLTELPETYDETKAREKAEKSGKLDRERQLADALTALGPLGQLPEALTRFVAQLTGGLPPSIAGQLECPNGHASPAGQKFCGHCAAPLSATVARASLPGPQQPPQPPSPDVKVPRMRDGRIDVLKAFAAANGLDGNGNRAGLIARLSNAGLTARWAEFAGPYYAGARAA